MESKVSRLTDSGQLVIDGKPACTRCGRRPKRRSGGRWQSYCAVCRLEYEWERKQGKISMAVRTEDRGLVLAIRRAKLSAEERDMIIDAIVELRIEPAGRHHAGLS